MNETLDTRAIDAALQRAAQKALHGTRADRSGRFVAPKAFISYSHDSPAHKEWVLKLATDLRAAGVDVVLDQWDLVPGQDISMFMQKEISDADRVVMICSDAYVDKAEKGLGGVGYERSIVTSEIVASIDTTRFIPVLRGAVGTKKIPSFLGPRLYINFENDSEYSQKLIDLAREIHNVSGIPKPPMGPNPFSGMPGTSSASRTIGTTGALTSDKFLLNEWFSKLADVARAGIGKLQLTAHMELRVGILHPPSRSQIELLNAVRQSEIQTFGWPIGILLENREEYRPRPFGDGIRAEISIADADRKSFDYWAVRSNGDFFLLQSLFEDMRRPNEVFFDTRIVRVTECLMFAQNLYTKLGVGPEAQLSVMVSHRGLRERQLTAASLNRLIFPKKTIEDESTTEIVTILGTMHETRVEDVRNLLAPLFALFDFTQFDLSVYEDIVRNFERGRVR